MLMDSRTLFAEETALSTSGTGLQLVGDVIDLENVRDVGSSENLYLIVLVSTAVTSGGAATVAFSLVSDAQAAIAVDGSATVHATSKAHPKANLVAGFNAFQIAVPPEGDTLYERYLGILANVGAAALTAGAVTAFLTTRLPNRKIYPNAAQ